MKDFLQLHITSSFTFSSLLSYSVYFTGEFSKLFSSHPFNMNPLVSLQVFSPLLCDNSYVEYHTVSLRKPPRLLYQSAYWLAFLHMVFLRFATILLTSFSDLFSVSSCDFLPNPDYISIFSFGSFCGNSICFVIPAKVARRFTPFWIFGIRHWIILVNVQWDLIVFPLMTVMLRTFSCTSLPVLWRNI